LRCYHLFKELVGYYAAAQVLAFIDHNKIKNSDALWQQLPSGNQLPDWSNVGGQLIPSAALQKLLQQIRSGKIKNWSGVHGFYQEQSSQYAVQKLQHALAAFQAVHGINLKRNKAALKPLLQQALNTRTWMVNGIYESRARDYNNPFRKMVYENAG